MCQIYGVLLVFLVFLAAVSNVVDAYEWNARHEYEVDDDDSKPPIGGTQNVYKHIQIGSAVVPSRGARVHVVPETNRSVEYVARVDTTIISPGSRRTNSRYQAMRRPKTNYVTKSSGGRVQCLKCPPERTVIAQKGVDGVLIELPPVMNCQNQPLSNYELQTLFGNKYPFVLTQGSHSFFGRIVNLKTKQVEQTCFIKTNVIVRQCPKYFPQSRDLKLKCDSGNIWGSKCLFACREGLISHQQEYLYCNNDLEWTSSGVEPQCFYKNEYLSDNEIPTTRGTCELPLPPRHGKFSCDTKSITKLDGLEASGGSICRVKCNKNFEILPYLEPFRIFHCSEKGHWNSTMMDFCSRIRKRNNI